MRSVTSLQLDSTLVGLSEAGIYSQVADAAVNIIDNYRFSRQQLKAAIVRL